MREMRSGGAALAGGAAQRRKQLVHSHRFVQHGHAALLCLFGDFSVAVAGQQHGSNAGVNLAGKIDDLKAAAPAVQSEVAHQQVVAALLQALHRAFASSGAGDFVSLLLQYEGVREQDRTLIIDYQDAELIVHGGKQNTTVGPSGRVEILFLYGSEFFSVAFHL